jgi:hypothetical protein
MKTILSAVFCASLFYSGTAFPVDTDRVVPELCKTAPSSLDRVQSIMCHGGHTYRLRYVQRSRRIVLTVDSRQLVLHRIPGGYDPSLVGSDKLIGFLPNSLQPYGTSNILLYISSIRTNGGSGGGQCGSGSEIYLNFLDVRPTIPKLKSSILIGSCEESIELLDQDTLRAQFGAISVIENQLSLQFMFYKKLEGDPIATVSPDHKQLLFP